MILVDFSQMLIASVMQESRHPDFVMNERMIKHIALNNLRANIRQFKDKYGKVVICCDSRKHWRKSVFPLYKMNRKASRDSSDVDWAQMFTALDNLKQDIDKHFPYRLVEVEGAEADDVIAVLTQQYHDDQPILILSSDKDFVQLQKYKNVTQYNPISEQYISSDDPIAFIKEHIFRGDRGDGIPNCLSPDNIFATDARQKSITKAKLAHWLALEPANYPEEIKYGCSRNATLIDFDNIPKAIQSAILDKFDSSTSAPRMDLLSYLVANNMKKLIESVGDF